MSHGYGTSAKKRNRRWLRIFYEFQNGYCCHCRHKMIHPDKILSEEEVTKHHGGRHNPMNPSIEHVVPYSKNKELGNSFSNMLAAHRDCNEDRRSAEPSEELAAYHKEIHRRIFAARNPQIHARLIFDFAPDTQAFANAIPHGFTKNDVLENNRFTASLV